MGYEQTSHKIHKDQMTKLTEESQAIPKSLPQNTKPVITNIITFESPDNTVNQRTHLEKSVSHFLTMEKACVYLSSMIYLTTLITVLNDRKINK
jgi:hypothetical protein